jgi:hypothetical protein
MAIALAMTLAFASSLLASTNVTAVSYVNTSLVPGFSLVSNPLVGQDNRISALFGNIQQLPDRFSVFLMVNGAYQQATFNTAGRQFEPEELANRELLPGEGVFIYNPARSDLLITFAGTIPQGVFTNRLPAGLSILSSTVPREGTPDEMSFPREPGDVIYFFDEAAQRFQASVFDDLDNAWLPPLKKLSVGEAFVLRKNAAADWVQRLSLNGLAGQALTERAGDSSTESFVWTELFAPFPMRPGNSVSLGLDLIPGGASLQISVVAPSGETFFALDFQDGIVNSTVPYRAGTWNELLVNADLDSQMFELRLNGLAAGSFPLGEAASLFVPSISEFRVTMLGFPGIAATAWIDNVKLSFQTVSLMNLLEIDFDQTVPRSTANPGTLRKEARP